MNSTILIIIIGLIFYIITCFAFFDIAKKDFGTTYKKVLWGIITLIPFLGCIIYFIFGYRKRSK